MQFDYDVIILGGGMAGLTLAMQLKQKQADISVAILEMRKEDAPLSAHKVGESTVELGTYYLREGPQFKRLFGRKSSAQTWPCAFIFHHK